VIKAITYNKYQIMLTALLGMVIVYIYSLFGYYYLMDSFWNDNFGESGENQCTTVFHCFLTIFSLGPRSSGSIGDMMVRESYAADNKVKWYIRFFFDVSVFIIVNITLMNIIFGIIIDTFAALRDKMTKVTQNMNTVCFVCSLDKITVLKF
jgi:Ion transport protein